MKTKNMLIRFTDSISRIFLPKRVTREESLEETAPHRLNQLLAEAVEAFNEDDIIAGKGLDRYQSMVRDPFVKNALFQKKQAVVSLNWIIRDGGDTAIDKQIAEFVRFAFDNMGGVFENFLLDMLDALDMGYSVSEMNYVIIETGEFKGLVGLKNIKGKNPENFDFHTDKYGNIIGMRTASEHRELNPQKFIIFTYLPRYGEFFGTSDLRAAHRPFILKELTYRFRAIYVQKFAVPTLVGKFPRGKMTPKQQNDLLDTLDAFNEDTAIVVPEDVVIEALEIAASTESVYQNMISDLNKEIMTGILGSFLQTMEGTETGARSIGEVHERTANQAVNFLAAILSSAITDQVIVRLVDMNFPGVVRYPFMSIDVKEIVNKKEESEILKTLVETGVPVPVSFVQDRFNIPVPKDDEPILEKAAPQPLFDDAVPSFSEKRKKSFLEDRTGVDILQEDDYGFVSIVEFAERNDRENLDLARGAFEDSVSLMDKLNMRIKNALSKHPRNTRALVKAVLPKASALQEKFRDSLLTGNLQGRTHIAELLARDQSRFSEGGEIVNIFQKKIIKPLNPSKASEEFRVDLGLTNKEFTALKKRFNIDSEEMMEAYLEAVSTSTQASLASAVAKGVTQKEFIAGLTPKKMRLFSEAQLKTAYRNEVTSAYTLGRIEETRDPDVAPFIQFWEYVTMQDESVREEHAAVHGVRLPEDDPFWNAWFPPNGHNCRCQALPISTFRAEAQNLQEVQPPKGVTPDEGFDVNMLAVAIGG